MPGNSGSGRKSRHAEDKAATAHVRAESGAPKMPSWLGPRAKTVWKNTVKILEAMEPSPLSLADGDMLAQYCDAWQRFFDAKKTVETEGYVLQNRHGSVKHPAVAILNDAITAIDRFGSKFGLSPVDRKGLQLPTAGKKESAKLSGVLGSRAKSLKVVS